MENGNDLEEEFLVDGAAGGIFALLWETMTELDQCPAQVARYLKKSLWMPLPRRKL